MWFWCRKILDKLNIKSKIQIGFKNKNVEYNYPQVDLDSILGAFYMEKNKTPNRDCMEILEDIIKNKRK